MPSNTKKVIDLTRYDQCKPEEATLEIKSPQSDGSVLSIFYRSRRSREYIHTLDEVVVWCRNMKFDTALDSTDYIALVDWYFDNMGEDFKEDLRRIAKDATATGFDLRRLVEKLHMWLRVCEKDKRKSNLDKFLVKNIANAASRWVMRGKGILG